VESHFDLDVNAASPAVHAVLEEAGARIPEEWEIEGPAVSISLGDATDLYPALLAAMCGPDGLGGQVLADAAPGLRIDQLTRKAAIIR
jgi:hypothetical protein